MSRKVRIDMRGLRFGRLVGIGYTHTHSGRAFWLFQCDCGEETIANGTAVRAGRTASCGCLHREVSAARLQTHGRRACKRHDATYRAWQEMKNACSDPASPKYAAHGRLGTIVCGPWSEAFEAFLSDMGERPNGTKLARIDACGNFTADNCEWIPVEPRSARARSGWLRRIATEERPADRSRTGDRVMDHAT